MVKYHGNGMENAVMSHSSNYPKINGVIQSVQYP